MSAVLQGLRVIELGQVFAAPFAGAILSDLGAQVTKVERVEGGDDARRMGPPSVRGDALNFHIFNRGKRSVTLDLKTSKGLADLHALLEDADVLVHNLRPGVAEQLGVDAGQVTARHPRLIYAEISAFGAQGPLAHQPGYEPLIQAFSGLSALNGGEGDPPMRSAASVCDQGTGMWLVIGILALLHQRQRTGRGGVVQSSLLETALAWNAQKSDALVNEGRLPQRHRSGHPDFVPYEAFDTADHPLLICCGNDRLFAKLAQALDAQQWITDPRFATNRGRLAHKAELFAQLQPLLQGQPRDHWLTALEAAGVPCAPVHSLPQAMAHPQTQALGMWSAIGGDGLQLTALPLTIDGERPQPQGPAPALGEHNTSSKETQA
jgi:crotonobetainyl-CoA:carnitine CoA-transferase CaiB-like acyl-CoA transferase